MGEAALLDILLSPIVSGNVIFIVSASNMEIRIETGTVEQIVRKVKELVESTRFVFTNVIFDSSFFSLSDIKHARPNVSCFWSFRITNIISTLNKNINAHVKSFMNISVTQHTEKLKIYFQ